MELNEALYTTRAMRRVKPDPIPQDVVAAMMDAAVRAPSGGNSQNWRWLTVTDRNTMGRLGDLYRTAWEQLTSTYYAGRLEQAQTRGDETTVRVMKSSQWLADNFDEVPLVVLPFHRNDPTGASIYPAVWSLMLEARGHGVGTTLTTVLGLFQGAALFELFGVPTDKGWSNAAAVTCGYPLGRWGVAARAPAHEVVYSETWGIGPDWVIDQPLWPTEVA
jgi:nitroreductase